MMHISYGFYLDIFQVETVFSKVCIKDIIYLSWR